MLVGLSCSRVEMVAALVDPVFEGVLDIDALLAVVLPLGIAAHCIRPGRKGGGGVLVALTVEEVVAELGLELQLWKNFDVGARGDVEHTAVCLVGVLLQAHNGVVLGGRRLAQGVIGVAGLDERGQVLRGIIDAAAADCGEEVVLPAVLVAEVGVEPEPFEDIVGHIERTG